MADIKNLRYDSYMESDVAMMTPQQIEDLKPYLYILAIIPGLLIARFFFFMIIPKFILRKYFAGGKGYKKADVLKRKKRVFDE